MGSAIRELIQAATRGLRAETAAIGVGLAVRQLERRYRRNQPRAPRGTPTGGRWVDDVVKRPVDRREVADLTMFGRLTGRHRYGETLLLCVYDFGSQKWTMLYETTSAIGCTGLLHQADAFRRGTRLNDN